MRRRAEAAPRSVFAAALPAVGEPIAWNDDEARYLARVVRARAGASVTATDGHGGVAEVLLTVVGTTCEGRVMRRDQRTRGRTLMLMCGAPEGDRGDWLVEKAAEFGVAVLQPIDTERGAWTQAAAREARWQRLARAALRQSCGCWELELRPVLRLAEALTLAAGSERWLAEAGGTAAGQRPAATSGATTVVVGPASGFSDAERNALAENGFQSIALASVRLRAETAALAAAAWWAAAEPA